MRFGPFPRTWKLERLFHMDRWFKKRKHPKSSLFLVKRKTQQNPMSLANKNIVEILCAIRPFVPCHIHSIFFWSKSFFPICMAKPWGWVVSINTGGSVEYCVPRRGKLSVQDCEIMSLWFPTCSNEVLMFDSRIHSEDGVQRFGLLDAVRELV